MFKRSWMGVWGKFPRCFKGDSTVLQKVYIVSQENLIKSLKGVSRSFQWRFVLQFSCSINLIAATRAEGGLVIINLDFCRSFRFVSDFAFLSNSRFLCLITVFIWASIQGGSSRATLTVFCGATVSSIQKTVVVSTSSWMSTSDPWGMTTRDIARDEEVTKVITGRGSIRIIREEGLDNLRRMI